MKPIFALLLTYAFMTAQTFALSGGPVFNTGVTSVPGIYSGVLQGVTETDNTSTGPSIPGDPLPAPNPETSTASNAIGIFDLNVPTTNLATGAFMLFADGVVFGGTIDASADPDSGEILGILQGTYDFNLTSEDSSGTVNSTQVTAQALGKIDAQIRSTNSEFANSLARLTGTATLGVNFGQVDVNTLEPIVARTITFDVTGYKQSDASS